MFGFGKKEQPKTALDSFISLIYGEPPPPKRADASEAARLASEELLMGNISGSAVSQLTKELASSRVPYSTHDLALAVAVNFFKRPECMEQLREAQIFARLKMVEWVQEGLAAPMMVKSFENVLYALYKP